MANCECKCGCSNRRAGDGGPGTPVKAWTACMACGMEFLNGSRKHRQMTLDSKDPAAAGRRAANLEMVERMYMEIAE